MRHEPISPFGNDRKRSDNSIMNHPGIREMENSSDSEGLHAENEDHALTPFKQAWQYADPKAHQRNRPSMSSTGSAQRGRNMFDLEEDDIKDLPRINASSQNGAPRKAGQLRTLTLSASAQTVSNMRL